MEKVEGAKRFKLLSESGERAGKTYILVLFSLRIHIEKEM